MALGLAVATSSLAAPVTNEWFSLVGAPVAGGNPTGKNQMVYQVETPVLRVTRTASAQPQGTVLLFPGGGYKLLSVVDEGAHTAQFLNDAGYDVAMLEYYINSGPDTRELALGDALAAWRLLKARPELLGVDSRRSVLMGYSAGGHLAARVMQNLAAPGDTPPDDAVLVYPAYLEEHAAGAAQPAVLPPAHPRTRLVIIMAANDHASWLRGAQEYLNAWRQNGGHAIFQELTDGGHGFGMKPGLKGEVAQWPAILEYFLQNGVKPGVGPFNTHLPWFLKNEQDRLAEFRRTAAADQGAVVFLGDSITEGWNLTAAFPKLKTANRGLSGGTTRGMLNRLQATVLDLHPRAIVFMGGINDLDNQPRGTPETIAANVRSILQQARAARPATPVLVCEVLPSPYAPPAIIQAVNAAVDQVVAEFPNARRVKTFAAFLQPDGTENFALFKDGTHPNAEGYAVWKKTLLPELEKALPEN